MKNGTFAKVGAPTTEKDSKENLPLRKRDQSTHRRPKSLKLRKKKKKHTTRAGSDRKRKRVKEERRRKEKGDILRHRRAVKRKRTSGYKGGKGKGGTRIRCANVSRERGTR